MVASDNLHFKRQDPSIDLTSPRPKTSTRQRASSFDSQAHDHDPAPSHVTSCLAATHSNQDIDPYVPHSPRPAPAPGATEIHPRALNTATHDERLESSEDNERIIDLAPEQRCNESRDDNDTDANTGDESAEFGQEAL